MTRLGWMLAQAAVFAGLWYLLYRRGLDVGNPGRDAATGAMFWAFLLTLLLFGIINLIHNRLLRRRARRVVGRADLAEEPDHGSHRLGRSGPMSEEATEVIEIPGREKTRKLLRPPS